MPQYGLNDFVFHAKPVKIGCQPPAESMPAVPLDAGFPLQKIESSEFLRLNNLLRYLRNLGLHVEGRSAIVLRAFATL
jgi:hypothetical protein